MLFGITILGNAKNLNEEFKRLFLYAKCFFAPTYLLLVGTNSKVLLLSKGKPNLLDHNSLYPNIQIRQGGQKLLDIVGKNCTPEHLDRTSSALERLADLNCALCKCDIS